MQEDAQEESTIHTLARVEIWIVTVKQQLTDNEIRGGHRQMLYAGTYNKILLGTINRLLDTIRLYVESWEPGEPSTIEEPGLYSRGHEMPHFRNELRACMDHQCTIFRLQVYASEE